MAELQQRMSSREFAEWLAFYALEPFGDERADARSAIIATLIANANRDPKKKREPFTIDDFMIVRDEPVDRPQHQTWQEQKARMTAFFNQKA